MTKIDTKTSIESLARRARHDGRTNLFYQSQTQRDSDQWTLVSTDCDEDLFSRAAKDNATHAFSVEPSRDNRETLTAVRFIID